MTLGVLAAYRQLGLGSAILRAILQDARARGTAAIGLHVHVSNTGARAFYEHRGFHVHGTVHNYYRRISPNAALLLQLDLRAPCATDADPPNKDARASG